MSTTGCKFYYNNIDYRGSDICRNEKTGYLKCPFVDKFEECQFSDERVEIPAKISTEAKVNRPPIKLELVQYPYSKAGRPTVYLDDYQIAGPRAFGVGHTVASYELTKENLKDIQRIVTRELNRINEVGND